MGVTGELLFAPRNGAAVHEQLRPVIEGVLQMIRVEVLVDRVAPVVTTAEPDRLHRPTPFDPTRLIDVVDQKIADGAAAKPQESMEVLDLVHQLAAVGAIWRGGGRTGRPGHSIT